MPYINYFVSASQPSHVTHISPAATGRERETEVTTLGLQSGAHLGLPVRLTGEKQFGNQNFKVARKMGGSPRGKIRS